MPLTGFKSVREVSSEADAHRAENLLQQSYGKKWKTKVAGEKMAYVILELEEPKTITGIDIGNEHSAFVQVLVGQTAGGSFTDILLTCSFMTPSESRSSTNPNRVRCFGQEALVPSAAEEKWKMLKIMCTQPFNTHVQYGLCFIKVHVVEAAQPKLLVPLKFQQAATTGNVSTGSKMAFRLREDSQDSDSASTSLFKRWKMERNGERPKTPPSAAAAIRDAALHAPRSHQTDEKIAVESPKVLDRNRDFLLFGDEDVPKSDAKYQKLAKHLEIDKVRHKRDTEERLKREPKRESAQQPDKKIAAKPQPEQKRRSSPAGSSQVKKQKTENTALQKQYRPLNNLLQGVVLVISGIQNPDRADLRQKAGELGAKYRADWSADCTHLICAFRNTPKYQQVKKSKAKIVTRKWIEDCHTQKKYLPWRRYALDSTAQVMPESDEEITDETLKPTSSNVGRTSINAEAKRTKASEKYDESMAKGCSSGSDTDDEIQRVLAKNGLPVTNSDDVYDATTEEEDYLQETRDRLNANEKKLKTQ